MRAHSRPLIVLLFALLFFHLLSADARVAPGSYDLAAIRNPSTLETRVVQDWAPSPKDPAVRQKVVEITVCEWWPGQKIRLPVKFNAPANGAPCTRIIIANTGISHTPSLPSGAMLRLLKEDGVGVVLIGMDAIDRMEPVGRLDAGMKEHFLATKDARYTPAWIWGISDMRALTAACAESSAFQPVQVLATGGSKCGVASAAAGIFDDRFTAIFPYAAPVIESPGGPYVEGLLPGPLQRMNAKFMTELEAGHSRQAPAAAGEFLRSRAAARAAERITLEQARAAGWSPSEIRDACSVAWEVCRITHYLPELRRRGLEIFYNQGSNDNVSPGLVELGQRFPDFPMLVIPGGQHGAPKTAGMNRQVGALKEVDDNLFAFAGHHFFKRRPLPAPPLLRHAWNGRTRRLEIKAEFPRGADVHPQANTLWWSRDRHPDYTHAMEYDTWDSAPLSGSTDGKFSGVIQLPKGVRTVDFVTVHEETRNGSTLTLSSPVRRIDVR